MYNRTRRLRKSEGIRRLVQETKLSVDDFVYPLFIEEGENIETEIVSMPGIKRYSLDRISKELEEVVELNIPAVLLFGIPSNKDEEFNNLYYVYIVKKFNKKEQLNLEAEHDGK